jgi:hypothetical protein
MPGGPLAFSALMPTFDKQCSHSSDNVAPFLKVDHRIVADHRLGPLARACTQDGILKPLVQSLAKMGCRVCGAVQLDVRLLLLLLLLLLLWIHHYLSVLLADARRKEAELGAPASTPRPPRRFTDPDVLRRGVVSLGPAALVSGIPEGLRWPASFVLVAVKAAVIRSSPVDVRLCASDLFGAGSVGAQCFDAGSMGAGWVRASTGSTISTAGTFSTSGKEILLRQSSISLMSCEREAVVLLTPDSSSRLGAVATVDLQLLDGTDIVRECSECQS